jgi:hypothetical protein
VSGKGKCDNAPFETSNSEATDPISVAANLDLMGVSQMHLLYSMKQTFQVFLGVTTNKTKMEARYAVPSLSVSRRWFCLVGCLLY